MLRGSDPQLQRGWGVDELDERNGIVCDTNRFHADRGLSR